MKKPKLLLGCDPEVFVVNENGEPVSAHGMIPGTKAFPLVVKDGMVQVDGMALEFGITPAATKRQFITRIKSVLTTLDGMLPKGHSLLFTPIVNFSQEVIDNSPPEALELGCEPDYNAYTLDQNPRPAPKDKTLRSAGGHVHLGWGADFDPLDPNHRLACAGITIALDGYLGVPSLGWDSNSERRKLYGSAGAFRPKSYGMEYRTLSNQWLLEEDTIEFVWDQTQLAFAEGFVAVKESFDKKKYFNNGVTLSARNIINNNWTRIGKSKFQELTDV